jgi:MerR family transcriptional regulator/heat shock protein HspR
MEKEFWTVTEVIEIFGLKESFLSHLENEEIVCPICREEGSLKLFSYSEVEKVRIAKILVEDMDVNLSGVEIILRMRQNMIDMRRQFDAILEELRGHFTERLKGRP